jgi:hypothetical protein
MAPDIYGMNILDSSSRGKFSIGISSGSILLYPVSGGRVV